MLPLPRRRLTAVCAPGYTGRKRGEVVRSRTVALQMHTRQWIGTYAGRGNGDYRSELASSLQAITTYLRLFTLTPDAALVRLDGQYGDAVAIAQLLEAGVYFVTRARGYRVLEHPQIQRVLAHPPAACVTRVNSDEVVELFEGGWLPLNEGLSPTRIIVARHRAPEPSKRIPVGKRVGEWIYELFITTLPLDGFLVEDVLDLYHGRGAFEAVLADEDVEEDPDRWCSYTEDGQELWQIACQWLWNLRLDMGQHFSAVPLRLTEFAAAAEPSAAVTSSLAAEPALTSAAKPTNEPVRYGPPRWARRSFTKGFAGSDFVLQPDVTLRCPAGHPLTPHERRPERHGSVRIVYGARISHCRPCPLRAQCLESPTTRKPRQVSAVLWPMDVSVSVADRPAPATADPPVGTRPPALAPVLWGDWPRCQFRRSLVRLLRRQTVEVTVHTLPSEESLRASSDTVYTRAERAHWRLSWQQRLARNARPASAPLLTVTIHGLPPAFAQYIGVNLVAAA